MRVIIVGTETTQGFTVGIATQVPFGRVWETQPVRHHVGHPGDTVSRIVLVHCFIRSNTLLVTIYMTWTSTICVVIMATYGRTLCWKKRNTVPNTGGVFAVGAI